MHRYSTSEAWPYEYVDRRTEGHNEPGSAASIPILLPTHPVLSAQRPPPKHPSGSNKPAGSTTSAPGQTVRNDTETKINPALVRSQSNLRLNLECALSNIRTRTTWTQRLWYEHQSTVEVMLLLLPPPLPPCCDDSSVSE